MPRPYDRKLQGKTTLFQNGRIWRHGAEDGEWMVVKDSKVLGIGRGSFDKESNFECIIDLHGRYEFACSVICSLIESLSLFSRVLPGLHDSHIHVYMLGEAAQYLNLDNVASVEELQRRLAAHASQHEKAEWIVGIMWRQQALGRYPTRADLDRVVPDRPVFLWRACWHIACANTQALKLAGLMKVPVPPIPGGMVDVADDGMPTGIVRETASEAVASLAHASDFECRHEHFRAGIRQCLRCTRMHS